MKRLAFVLLSAVAAGAWLSPASGATHRADVHEAAAGAGVTVWPLGALVRDVDDRGERHRRHWRHDDEGDDWDGGDGGVHTHIYFGLGPIWQPLWSPYTGPPRYWRRPTVVVSPPPVYISRDDANRQLPTYWYYCPAPKGYYPYIKSCPPGWLTVVPHPPHH